MELGKWLGYFELSTNGAMTYVAYPSTTPVIASINRSGTSTTINYTTGLYGTYKLLESSDLSAPVSTWTTVATLTSGDTATHTYTDTTSDTADSIPSPPNNQTIKTNNKFYQTISTKTKNK